MTDKATTDPTVFDCKTWEGTCLGCGDVLTVPKPVEFRRLAEMGRLFVELHVAKGCRRPPDPERIVTLSAAESSPHDAPAPPGLADSGADLPSDGSSPDEDRPKIEPCPFPKADGTPCEGRTRVDGDAPCLAVECPWCGALGPACPTRHDAIEAWNRAARAVRERGREESESELRDDMNRLREECRRERVRAEKAEEMRDEYLSDAMGLRSILGANSGESTEKAARRAVTQRLQERARANKAEQDAARNDLEWERRLRGLRARCEKAECAISRSQARQDRAERMLRAALDNPNPSEILDNSPAPEERAERLVRGWDDETNEVLLLAGGNTSGRSDYWGVLPEVDAPPAAELVVLFRRAISAEIRQALEADRAERAR